MSWLTRNHNQVATLWALTGVSVSGDPTFAAAKSVLVRWEERTAVFTTTSGEEASASAVVFMGEDVVPGDFLFLGASVVADPTTVAASREVQGFSKIPQLKGPDFERRAFLSGRRLS